MPETYLNNLNGFHIVSHCFKIREIPIRTFRMLRIIGLLLQEVNGAVSYSDLNIAKLDRTWTGHFPIIPAKVPRR